MVAFGQFEDFAIGVVEARGDVAREFEVLGLVGTDWYIVSLVEQDVASHQGRVGEEAGIDVVGVFGGLVFELRHS